MTLHEHLAYFSQWFWAELANHLWQSTLFFLAAGVSLTLLRGASPKLKYLAWLAAFAKFAVPSSAFVALGKWLNLHSIFSPTSGAGALQFRLSADANLITIVSPQVIQHAAAGVDRAAASHNETYCVLTLVWVFGCALLFALWRKRSLAFRAALSYGNKPASDCEIALLASARKRLGLNSEVGLMICASVSQPFVWGIRKPIIVIPQGLSTNLTRDEFELILVHELTHVARRDNLFGVLQMAVCCLLWFYPLVWFIKRKLWENRELACDEAVVSCEGEPRVYASGLLKVARFGLFSSGSAGLAGAGGSDLSKRVELIMENRTKNTSAAWRRWTVVSTFALLILVCAAAAFTAAPPTDPNDNAEFIAGQIKSVTDEDAGGPDGADSPLRVVEVKSTVIPDSDFPKSTPDAPVLKVYSDLEIKIVNASEKTVTGFLLTVKRKSDSRILHGSMSGSLIPTVGKLSIAPGQSYFVRTYASEPDFYVAVLKVKFEDDSVWTFKEPAETR